MIIKKYSIEGTRYGDLVHQDEDGRHLIVVYDTKIEAKRMMKKFQKHIDDQLHIKETIVDTDRMRNAIYFD